MAVSDRAARGVLSVLAAVLAAVTLSMDLPKLSGGQFWSDGATYYSMAWSLAEDLDVRYQPQDLERVRREFPNGPQGVFLKRTNGGWGVAIPSEKDRPIYFAKALAYPLLAAPFVRVLGTRGLLFLNGLAFALALWLGYGELRRHTGAGPALVLVLVLFGASVAPLYLLWPMPEIVNFALVVAGLAAWRRGRPLLSALLLGFVTYSKPYNLLLAIPLGIAPLLPGQAASFLAGFKESLRRGLTMGVTILALFGLNVALTGEANYQGGERKTFIGRFPFESPAVTFGNSGTWMTTNQPGPAVEGEDTPGRGEGPPRAAEEIRLSFLYNLGYFWIGRFGGALPYYPAAVTAAVLFLLFGPRDREGWLALGALVASFLLYVVMIPDNWYGGGGTLGNRYFLNLLPLALYLVPRGRGAIAAVSGTLLGGWLVGPLLAAPMAHTLHPGRHATAARFRLFPAELTMLNDLSVFTEPWRKKRSFGDTEGDPHKHWPADPKAYYLYFLDDGTLGPAALDGAAGFWLRGGEEAELVLRALEPVRRMTLRLTAGPLGDEVTACVARECREVALASAASAVAVFEPALGFPYYDTRLHLLKLRSRRPNGSFAAISLEVERRRRR